MAVAAAASVRQVLGAAVAAAAVGHARRRRPQEAPHGLEDIRTQVSKWG